MWRCYHGRDPTNCPYVEGETGSTNIGRFKWLIRYYRQRRRLQLQPIIIHLISPDLYDKKKKHAQHSISIWNYASFSRWY